MDELNRLVKGVHRADKDRPDSAATKVALSLDGLPKIGGAVSVPSYSRGDLSPGIVHVGVGNFHRAHQAWYLHRLFESGRDHDWAIIGAGVKQFDSAMREKLLRQDWLTTLVELDPDGYSAMVLGAMIDFVEIDARRLIATLSQPHVRIVSLTVTEGGYFVNAKTGGFDRDDPEIVADARTPEDPKTIFGILIAALTRRRHAGIAPFTVMSCDNLPENGHVTRAAVLGLAEAWGSDTHDWISDHVAFPNSMVDCITPATGEREIQLVSDCFKIEDLAPVVCEPFRQWVLEDKFPLGRPALESVGVEFVDDVAPHELMKLRILNGGHAVIAYAAGLLDIHYVHEAMAHPVVAGYLDRVETEEIIPHVPAIPGVSRDAYFEEVVARFSNPAIGDTVQRLCLDGSNRQPKFILPAIQARLETNQSIDGLALATALWCRYCYGKSDGGRIIPANDPSWDRLTRQAKLAKEDPQHWLEMEDIYGALARNTLFRTAFSEALNRLWTQGTRATLSAYINA